MTRNVKDTKLAERVEERLLAGQRPEALAALAGVSVSTLYWVRRTGVMSTATAEKLTAVLDGDMNVAEGGIGTRP
jgi:hypothetical protein